jgi:ABC-type nickel/cobalt efflux system permease component RcnA
MFEIWIGQMGEYGLLIALAIGLGFGFIHAFEPDHMVAVSTIVGRYRNPFRSFWIGISWGLGHTTTLLLIGIVIIALKVSIPASLAPYFEGAVALMLIGLGVQVIYSIRKNKVHQHIPGQEGDDHSHSHSHADNPADSTGDRDSKGIGRPFFRTKSYVIGTVHGLAGSAALIIIVTASITSPLTALAFILLFGLGSVLSMGLVTIIISFPFVLTANRAPNLNRYIQRSFGVLSILLGFFLVYGFLAETGVL